MDGLKAVPFRKTRRAGRAPSALRSGRGCGGIYRGYQIRVHPLSEVSRLQASDGEMAVLVAEDMILPLSGAVDPAQSVRLVEHQLGGDLLWEKYLAGVRGVSRLVRGSFKMAAYPHFEMDVVGAAHVVAGKDGLKVHRAIGSRQLNSTQEGQVVGGMILRWRPHFFRRRRRRTSRAHGILLGEAGIEAERITVPKIDSSVGQRLARSRVQHLDAEGKRHPGLAFHDVGTDEFSGNVVGSLLLLGDETADIGVSSERRTLQLERSRQCSSGDQKTASSEVLIHGFLVSHRRY